MNIKNGILFEKKIKAQSDPSFFKTMRTIRLIGDDSRFLCDVRTQLMQKLPQVVDIDIELVVTEHYVPDDTSVDVIFLPYEHVRLSLIGKDAIIHKGWVYDTCEKALIAAGYLSTPTVEKTVAADEQKFFQESDMEDLKNASIQQFIESNLEQKKLTVKLDLTDVGYYDITDKSIGDMQIRKEKAMWEWFAQHGLSRSRLSIARESFGWRIMVTQPRADIQIFSVCPDAWDDDVYAVFCATSDFKSVSRVKKGDMMDMERFVTPRQVEKMRELAKNANVQPTGDFYVMVDKSLFSCE